MIFKNGNYFDPNTGVWITLGGLVVWQEWHPGRGLPAFDSHLQGIPNQFNGHAGRHRPAGGKREELAERSVCDQYIVSLLASKGQSLIPDNDDGLAVDGAEGGREGGYGR
ncbi:MAG TPA: hypothetical protein EYH05_16810 [Anaerolineae bacterium]|nr:hypothetical protein [Anaerolineae bacterium]